MSSIDELDALFNDNKNNEPALSVDEVGSFADNRTAAQYLSDEQNKKNVEATMPIITEATENINYLETPESEFEAQTGINPNESLWDEITAAATGFGQGASLGIVSQDDNPIVQSAQEVNPTTTAIGDALGSVATTIASSGLTSAVTAPKAIQSITGLNKVISSALSRGLIFGQTSGVRNTVDVAKGKKDVTQAMKDLGAGTFGSMFSILPEAIPGPKFTQLILQPASGVLVDWGTRRLLDEYPDEAVKENEGSMTNFIKTYGFNILLDMGFAMMDVNDRSFKSNQKQIRRELAAMASHPLNSKSYLLKKIGTPDVSVDTHNELDLVYKQMSEETGRSVEDLKADVVEINSQYDNVVNTYGKVNKIPEAIAKAESYGKEKFEAEEKADTEIKEAIEDVPEVIREEEVEIPVESKEVDSEVKIEPITEEQYSSIYEQNRRHNVKNLEAKLNRTRRPLSNDERIVISDLIAEKRTQLESKAAASKVKKASDAKAKEESRAIKAQEKIEAKAQREADKIRSDRAKEIDYIAKQKDIVSRRTTIKQLENLEATYKRKGMSDSFKEDIAAKKIEIQNKANEIAEAKEAKRAEKIKKSEEKKANAIAEKEARRIKREADQADRQAAKDIAVANKQAAKEAKQSTAKKEIKKPIEKKSSPTPAKTNKKVQKLIEDFDRAVLTEDPGLIGVARNNLETEGYTRIKKVWVKSDTEAKTKPVEVKTGSIEEKATKYVQDISKLLNLRESEVRIEKLEDGNVALFHDIEGSPIKIDSDFIKTASDEQVVSVLNHEIGHSTIKQAIDINKSGKRIDLEHRYIMDDLEDDMTVTLREYLKDNHGSQRVERVKETNSGMLDRTMYDIRQKDSDYFDYITSRDEWIADNVAKWLATDKEPLSKLDKIFKSIADTFRKLFKNKSNEDIPNKKIAEFLNGRVNGKNVSSDWIRSYSEKTYNIDKVDPPGDTDGSFIDSNDIENIRMSTNTAIGRSINKIIDKAIKNADGGTITEENNRILLDNFSTILKYANEGSLSPKMKSLKQANDKLIDVFSGELKEVLSDFEAREFIDQFNKRNEGFKNTKFDADKLASAYLGNRNEFQYNHPELFSIVDAAVKTNIGGVREDLSDYNTKAMTEGSSEVTVKQTESVKETIKTSEAKDSDETLSYSERISSETKSSFEKVRELREGKNKRKIGKEAGLKSKESIEKVNAFYDTAYGFRYYAGKITKALGNVLDDKTRKAVKKLGDVAEKDVRSADYVEIKVDSYMKDMENKIFAKLEPGEEHNFKMHLLMKSILNDENMPDDFELKIGDMSITKEGAETWLNDIDSRMSVKYDELGKEMHEIRSDWIMDSMDGSGVFPKEYVDFMRGNSSYVHMSIVNSDLKAFENDLTLDHVGNAFKVVKSKNYYKEGLLEDVLTSTIKQDVAILHAMENNRRKLDVVSSLVGIKALESDADISGKATVNDVIDELVQIVNPTNVAEVQRGMDDGVYVEYKYPKPDDLKKDGMVPVSFYDKGIKRMAMIDNSVESVFRDKEVNELFNTVSQNKLTGAIRSLYTTRNAGFVVFNFMSDAFGTAVRVSPKALLNYPKAFKDALKSTFGKEIDGIYKELAQSNALFGSGNYRNFRKNNLRLQNYLKSEGLGKKKPHEVLQNGWEKFNSFIDNVNTTVERTSKFAAATHLKEKGYSKKDIAHITREHAGSPNFMTGGYKFKTINNMFMFANPVLRGYHQFGDSIRKGSTITRAMVLGSVGLKVVTDILSRVYDEGPTDEEIVQGGLHIPVGYSVDDQGNYMRSYYTKYPIDRSIADIGGLMSMAIFQGMKAFDNREGTEPSITKVTKSIENLIPSLTPLIAGIIDAGEYATTGNITNGFGYQILTRDESYGGPIDNAGKISKHFLTSFGLQSMLGKNNINTLTNQKRQRIKEESFRSKESEFKSRYTDDGDFLGGTAATAAIRDLGGLPVIGSIGGRFFKGSNYGTVENYRNIIDSVRGAKAQERVQVAKSVENIIDGTAEDGDWINVIKYPGQLSRIISGLQGDHPLISAIRKVPEYDDETRARIFKEWKQKREP